MNGYSCEILADSVNPIGQRVTTVQIRLPLVVWAEFLTHRTFSRNARSNRAVPSRVLIGEVLRNPFVPEFWGRDAGRGRVDWPSSMVGAESVVVGTIPSYRSGVGHEPGGIAQARRKQGSKSVAVD
jgi:hypothetical protein